MDSNAADTQAGVISSVVNWAKAPFSTSMDLTGWTLFVGMVITLSIIWMFILHDLKGEL